MYGTYLCEKKADRIREIEEEEKFSRRLQRNVTARAALAELGGLKSLYGLHTRKDRKRA